ncbi:MAG: glycosyltransferase, partial [Bryobacteraceae bacterium]|nr:glycosyltransferase [Bryobacteraceae bacterium]
PPGLVRQTHLIRLPRHSKSFPARFVRNCVRLLRRRPPLNDRFGGFQDHLRRALSGHSYALAVIEHFWCAGYVREVARAARTVILDLHNVESALMESCAALEAGPRGVFWRQFARIALRYERQLLPEFDLVLAASETDAARVGAIAPRARVAVLPNTIPRRCVPDVAEQEVIVFSGNLEYPPNIHAVRYFASRIWPVVRARRPALVWRLVGRNPEGVRPYVAGDARIQLTGPVEDPLPWLAAAKAVVVPVLSGSGTRVKILEAWAAGRAVISTSFGVEGLPARPGEHLLVADGADSFGEEVLAVVDGEALRRRLGQSGRRLYEAEFTWESAWKRLAELGI